MPHEETVCDSFPLVHCKNTQVLIVGRIEIFPDEGQGVCVCLGGFLLSYARLTLHLVSLDVARLRQHSVESDADPDLTSKTYFYGLAWALSVRAPFYKAMERKYAHQLIAMILRLNDCIARPPLDAMSLLSDLVRLILPLLPKWPALASTLLSLVTLVGTMADYVLERERRLRASDELQISAAQLELLEKAYGFFRSVDLAFQFAIPKKAAWVTSESSEHILRYTGNTYAIIALSNLRSAVQMANDLQVSLPEDVRPEDLPQIITYGWKFQLLKKHIMDGRMEVRVSGMESMQTDLVNVYRQYVQHNPAGNNHPVIRYLVDLLRKSKIVDYIVGVGSHPQLISRSMNIVGFLIVTDQYTEEDTDTIWHTVTECQDPRTVTEVLRMLTRTFSLHPIYSDALVYICKKVNDLPLERFDSAMIEFCDQLLAQIRDKHSGQMPADIVPVQLCVRLIREEPSVSELSPEQRFSLQSFSSRQLSQFIALSIPEDDKTEIYRQCIRDISDMNEFTVGSIQALNALIPAYDTQDISRLAADFNFTELIIKELVHTCESLSSDADAVVSLRPRLQLLQRIIDRVPDTITPEMSEMLWTGIFASATISHQGRSMAWDVLSRVAARCLGRHNSLLERYLNDNLQLLSPETYTPDIQAFAEQAVGYEMQFRSPSLVQEGQVIDFAGMHRIWHFMLTAPPGTIEMKATNFMIGMYLDHPLIRTAPRSAVEATHISLVERSMTQLSRSAAKLKSFNDGMTSGEDEPMVVVPSDGEIRMEELNFSRSLLFLRQLLRGLRTRPQYSPLQSSPPQLPLRPEETNGEIIDLSYQAFSGSGQTRIRTLQIGDLCTARNLADKLVGLTGFSKFSTFSAGQRLDLLGNADMTLRDLKLKGTGLLIIRKQADSFDSTAMNTGGKQHSMTLVDAEVLKHFDELYEFLGLEEKLAKEVCIRQF